ncbi:hypothetical protein [Pelomicrobium sp. G1]|uniref:hypothetical protein n=1 Tax=unclassified Pelomicrobium TaxID=2815318 RepID=UPI0021DC4E37|nr:MAG: hypothetical protein KatS3mg123_1295 [Burkholderiales bacterium]
MCYEDWYEWKMAREREALKKAREEMQRLKEQAQASGKRAPRQETEETKPETATA